MTFEKDGFLTKDLYIFIDRHRIQFKEWFELVDTLNQAVMHILPAIHVAEGNNQQFTAALLFSRALQSYQGAMLLAERGMIQESRTLVRSCAETAIILAKVAEDSSFVDRIVEAHHKHYLSLINVMSANPNAMKALPPEAPESFAKFKAEIKALYPDRKPRDYNLAEMAIDVEMTGLYDTIFRAISGDAAHPTIGAMMPHTIQDDNGEILDLRFEPVNAKLDVTLSCAVSSLLHTLDSMYQVFLIIEFKHVLNVYLAKWRAFENMAL
jgi:hypothetical protein